MKEQTKNYQYRFLTRIVLEAKTALSVGSGNKNALTDSLVARDVNGLPYIPGTAIAGIIKHSLDEEAQRFLGFNESGHERKIRMQTEKEANQSVRENIDEGSALIFSSAQMLGKEGKAIEGLVLNVFEDDYLKHFEKLPVRQHVNIDSKGVAVDGGKFDEEVVYKGTRFCFEMEMLSETPKSTVFDEILKTLASDSLMIGSGTRCGLGEVEMVDCKSACLDLKKKEDRALYLQKTSSLNDLFWTNKIVSEVKRDAIKGSTDNHITYELNLTPEDFFLFGSGFGDDDADATPVTGTFFNWKETGKPKLIKNAILIPGSSVKGALSHRVAFHYNRLNGYTIKKIGNEYKEHELAKTGTDNQAIRMLFGYVARNETMRGNVIISDIIQKQNSECEKVLNHVAIDRFTGGAIDGALFSEKVTYGKKDEYILYIKVKKDGLNDEKIKESFEATLTDITNGMLPLGGGVNRGHGCFEGEWKIKGKENKI